MMKQIIPFKKDIILKTRIAEMTSITLEHTLELDDDIISGELILTGDYKMTEASIQKEEFEYRLPFEITLTDNYDKDTFSVEVEDFYYEIVNSDVLRINVELLITGEEEIDDITDIIEEDFSEDIDILEDELIESNRGDIKEDEEEDEEDEDDNIMVTGEKIRTLFDSLDDADDSFASYNVHIMREEDTLESITMKYKVTKEELKDYNDIDHITLGAKIIVPVAKSDE